MVLSGSGLGGFPKSISVLSLKYRLTSALKTFKCLLDNCLFGGDGATLLKIYKHPFGVLCGILWCGGVGFVCFFFNQKGRAA